MSGAHFALRIGQRRNNPQRNVLRYCALLYGICGVDANSSARGIGASGCR
jgi:hypothetical protein